MPCYEPGSTRVDETELEDCREAARILCGLVKTGMGKAPPLDVKRTLRWFRRHRALDAGRVADWRTDEPAASERAAALADVAEAESILKTMGEEL